jgi:hypothetical protein
VAGGDLDISQVHARVQHGRHDCMAEHVGVRPGDPHACRSARCRSRRVAA